MRCAAFALSGLECLPAASFLMLLLCGHAMAQRELAQAWKRACKDGCLSPWQQALAYGLSEAWDEIHGENQHGKIKWITDCCHHKFSNTFTEAMQRSRHDAAPRLSPVM